MARFEKATIPCPLAREAGPARAGSRDPLPLAVAERPGVVLAAVKGGR